MNPLDVFPGAEHLNKPSTPTKEPPLVLTIEQAAQRLEIGRSLMFALIKAGEIESIRIGRLHRIPYDALVSYVDSLRKPRQHQVA
jgi:excisionase family DNA binding protein